MHHASLCWLTLSVPLWSSAVLAEPNAIQSEWRQVSSEAGTCPPCNIILRPNGADLFVLSSNGWSAILRPVQLHGEVHAIGDGRWGSGVARPYSDEAFWIHLSFQGERLVMEMYMPAAGGPEGDVAAVFERS